MANISVSGPSRIDRLLPDYDFTAAYGIRIKAPASVVYAQLLKLDLNQLWLVRFLMTLRLGRRIESRRLPGNLPERLRGTGFVLLDEAVDEEMVIGVAGKFWRPDGGRFMELNANDFVSFSPPGLAKAAWNFRLQAESPATTILSTETRIKCFGTEALWRFRIYWNLIRPFSGLMRQAMLNKIRTEAESTAREAS